MVKRISWEGPKGRASCWLGWVPRPKINPLIQGISRTGRKLNLGSAYFTDRFASGNLVAFLGNLGGRKTNRFIVKK